MKSNIAIFALAFVASAFGLITEKVHTPECYDYIVVGAGTAGSVVAGQLSSAGQSVLALEAGNFDPATASNSDLFDWTTPRQSFDLWENNLFTEEFFTPKQPSAINMANKFLHGRGLGGSAGMNAALYSRPDTSYFDSWGISGWESSVFDPIFAGIENGRFVLEEFEHQTYQDVMFESLKNLGFTDLGSGMGVDPINGVSMWNNMGTFQASGSHVKANPYTNYFAVGLQTGMLSYKTGARVVKILTRNNKAYGARYQYRGEMHEVLANKEVIISAGYMETPKLLKLSGIGPSAELTQHQINIVQDLPGVGENLKYRPLANVIYSGVNLAPEMNLTHLYESSTFGEYLTFGTGPYAMSNSAIWGTNAPQNWMVEYTGIVPWFMSTPETLVFSCFPANVASTGSVTLKSANPFESPHVDPNIFTEFSDLQAIYTCIETIRNLPNVDASIQAVLGIELAPGAGVTSVEDVFGFAMTSEPLTYGHAFGSCKMVNSLSEDSNGCVDSELKVFGVENLRVVDISVFPSSTPTGPMGSVYAVAERAAQLILADSGASSHGFDRTHGGIYDICSAGSCAEVVSLPATPLTRAKNVCYKMLASPFVPFEGAPDGAQYTCTSSTATLDGVADACRSIVSDSEYDYSKIGLGGHSGTDCLVLDAEAGSINAVPCSTEVDLVLCTKPDLPFQGQCSDWTFQT